MNVLAIDGGTSNTRVALVQDGRVIGREACGVGANRNRDQLPEAIQTACEHLLSAHGLLWADITRGVASGMIGSELGLHAMGYCPTPATMEKIAAACEAVEGILPIPLWFLPGVRMPESGWDGDMMRGEEAEYFGIMAALPAGNAYRTVLLPGTHNKIIYGASTAILRFRTCMSGDMIAATAGHTILQHNVQLQKDIDYTALEAGFRTAAEEGLTAALFRIRAADKFSDEAVSSSAKSSFLAGALLEGDVRAVGTFPQSGILVGGSSPLRDELAYLLTLDDRRRVEKLDAALCENAPALGACEIIKYRL